MGAIKASGRERGEGGGGSVSRQGKVLLGAGAASGVVSGGGQGWRVATTHFIAVMH